MGILSSGMNILGSPVGGLFANLLFGGQQQRLNQQARAQQEALLGQALGVAGLGDLPGIPAAASRLDISRFEPMAQRLATRLGGLSTRQLGGTQAGLLGAFGPTSPLQRTLGGLPGQFGAANQALLERFARQAGGIAGQFRRGAGGLLGEFGAGARGITGGFETRLGEAMRMLEGRGAQAEEDISRRFRESLAGERQALRARGFGGTLAAGLARGSAREESAEQRRLQEQLRGERLGLFTGLTGQGLAAQERLLGAGTGLGQALLGAGTGLQAGLAGQQLGAGQAGQQFLGGLNLGALGQQGQLGQFLQNALMQAGQQNLSNLFQFGQLPIGVGQQVAGQAMGTLGPIDIRPPQQLQFPQILPPVR